MSAIFAGYGFGSRQSISPPNTNDYLYREIAGSDKRVDILSINAQIAPQVYMLAPAGVIGTTPPGRIFASSVMILRGAQQTVPPEPKYTGANVYLYFDEQMYGFELLWQEAVYAGVGMKPTIHFQPGEMSVIGNRSLYVVMGGIIGTLEPTATTAAAQEFVNGDRWLAVSGYDYNSDFLNNNQQQSNIQRSMPRFGVGLPNGNGNG